MNSLTIGNINNGYVRSEMCTTLIHSVIDDGRDRGLINNYISVQGTYIDDNRNEVVNLFLSTTKSEWLLFVDSDIEIDKSQIYKLYDLATTYNLYILGGIYFYGENHYSTRIRPMVYSRKNSNSLRGNIIYDMPEDKEYFEVDNIGTGCLLIHRSVFEKVYKKYSSGKAYWFSTIEDDFGFVGEDVYFCNNVIKHGYKIYATPLVFPNHYKTVIFNNDLYINQ
jgi:GT2 family glycosyltransferase